MKETSFIEQNKEKWSRFEELYASNKNNPEELSNLYMDMTEDLSYAQTFYKRRTVRVYLNQLAQRIFTGVHKQKGESLKKLFTVWKTSLPLEIYRSRKSLLFALIAFLLYALIGVITTHYNPDFPRIVMGNDYVDMTIANIEKGNPLMVYKSESQMSMFIQITTNNMKVAFLTFFAGFFFTFLTHILLFSNGVMLGSFQYFFHTKGLLITTFLGIWIHGAFEISAIVLAGGAGITAGNGWLFPKSYTRIQSLQLSTKRGLKIMMSLVPFIIAAGFLESYVTHNYQTLPEWSKWALISFSFALIIFYYVLYPFYVARKYPELVNDEPTFAHKEDTFFNFNKIRTVGEIIADTFQFYKNQFHKFGAILFTIIAPLVILIVWMQDVNHYSFLLAEHWYDWQAQLQIMMGYGFRNGTDFIAAGLWSLIFALMFSAVLWCMKFPDEPFSYSSFFNYLRNRIVGIWIANLALFCIVFALPWYGLLVAFFIIPLLITNAATAGLDDNRLGIRLKKGFKISSQIYGTNLLNLLMLTLFVALISQTIASVFSIHNTWNNQPGMRDLLDLLVDFVKRIAMIFTDDYMLYANIVRQIVYLLFIFLIMPLLVISTGFAYLNVVEKLEARGLRKEFEKFGKRKRNQESKFD